jgi:ATP-dependent DNA helicase RecG
MLDSKVRNMDAETLRVIVGQMRSIGGEPTEIEAKSGEGGYPKTAVESMVAFANTSGGVILIGIDETLGFSAVGAANPALYRDTAIGQANDAVEPPIHIDVEFIELEGKQVVVIDVPEATPDQKPIHLKSKGPSTGALIRSGDGDRRMTPAEIGLLYASRTQPVFDRAPVPNARISDLTLSAVARTLERVRAGAPALRHRDDERLMRQLGITVETGGDDVPTLGGLLTFGDFPQEFFPQLMISFVVYGEPDDDARFVDNLTIRGSIPAMVAEAVAAVRKHLRVRTVVTGEGREERLDYSMTAVREAVVNALLHRDYSPITQGTQIHIELYPDHLIVRSPGGIYGPISADELGNEALLSSSRNSVLSSILSDTYLPGSERLVAENRATGIQTMISEAKALGQNRPIFKSTVTQFSVSMSHSELLSPDTRAWLHELGGPWPTPIYEIALAMMRADHVTNEMLRQWGVDRIQAGAVLKDLVGRGLAVREGGRRFAHYVLAATPRAPEQNQPEDDSFPTEPARKSARQTVLKLLQNGGAMKAIEISKATGIGRRTVLTKLNELVEEGVVTAVGVQRSPNRRYSIAVPFPDEGLQGGL